MAKALMVERLGVDLDAIDIEGPKEDSLRTLGGDQEVWVFTFRAIPADPRSPRWALPLKVAVAKDGGWADLLR